VRKVKLHHRTEGPMAAVCVHLEAAEKLLTDAIAESPTNTIWLESQKDLNRIICDLEGGKDCAH